MKKWPPLKDLETAIRRTGVDFVEETISNDAINVYMTFDGKWTHQVQLIASSNVLYWKKLGNISYSFEFPDIKQARKWWLKFVKPKMRNNDNWQIIYTKKIQ